MTTQGAKDMLGRESLVSVETALQTILSHASTGIGTRILPLADCLGQVTAHDIVAEEDLPAHARSTMDGFAVIAADTYGATESLPSYLDICGEILMGELPTTPLTRGNCLHIPTGGLLPPGADAVVMLEHTIPVDATMVEIIKSVGEGGNIIRKGDDIAKGALAIPAGRRLRPQDLGLLAGLGIPAVEVFNPVRIGILSTGDEIIPWTQTPQGGQIRNINSITLASLGKSAGARVTDYGITADTEDAFFSTVRRAAEKNDIVLFSGGSSVGTRDLGAQAIDELGKPGVLLHGVALKPGKPLLFGKSGSTLLFGLPGHPVSAMVCFDLFVKPAICKVAGANTTELHGTLQARLTKNIASAPGRLDIVRVALQKEENGYTATPVLGKSGAISSLSRADGYIVVNETEQGILKNSTVEVYLYSI